MLVFLFHLNVMGFGAGFVGVDVFFVLSGFLITSLLLTEHARTGGVNLSGFWSRRARRLLPGLALMLVVVALVTMKTATFSGRAAMRGDLVSTTLYVANWHFISADSYFNNIGVTSPLAHTWSLGIEEQFYVLWPILLVALGMFFSKSRRGVAMAALVGAVASAVLLAVRFDPGAVDRAYMGTDARIFEPLLGAWAAVAVSRRPGRGLMERRGNQLAALGTVGLCALLFLIKPGGAFYYRGGAVLISICTVLIVSSLWVGRGGPVKRALEWRPVAWIGLISYGLYLWHWPFVVWLHIDEARGMGGEIRKLVVVAATFLVATLSFYLIERPIRTGTGWRLSGRTRNPRLALLRRPLIVLGLVPIVMGSVIGVSVASTEIPPPLPGAPVLMLTGDSVPERLETQFELATQSKGWRVESAAKGACPVTGERTVEPPPVNAPIRDANNCPTVPSEQESLVRTFRPDVIVWWDRWSLSSFVGPQDETVTAGTALFWRLRTERLDATVRRLTVAGGHVLFVGIEPPGMAAGDKCVDLCGPWRHFLIANYQNLGQRWNSMLEQYAAGHPDIASFMSVTDVVCKADVTPCDDRIDGRFGRPDGIHYRNQAASNVVNAIVRRAAGLIAAQR
jgi:peptidoglycan/LPS O-acetylase OafA/YrhL